VHQPLFTGFNLLTTHEKAVLQKEQVASQINNAELRLIVAIQDAFLGLLRARENVRSAEDSLVRLAVPAEGEHGILRGRPAPQARHAAGRGGCGHGGATSARRDQQ
jgi:hypothetical protein